MSGSNLQRLSMAVVTLTSTILAVGCQIDSNTASESAMAAQVTTTDVRLTVENLPRRGKYLWMGCVTKVTRALEESDGIASATFDSESETFLVSAEDGFRIEDAAERVVKAGRTHDEELGLEGTPDWILRNAE